MLRIGTSGWHYDHWKGPFYPEDLSAEDYLEYYAGHFSAAEINHSFYQLPKKKTLESWMDILPKRFKFAAKASRYLTHMKKLKDPRDPLKKLYNRMEILGDQLEVILFQLPPNWHANIERLNNFLELLSDDYRHVFEFRDPDWFQQATYDALAAHDAAFCIYELGDIESPREITAKTVYIRLHGPGDKYKGLYDKQTLSGWSGAISSWEDQGHHVYCFFDNDEKGYAVQNAAELQEMLK